MIGKKGDVDRYILYMIVILILIVLIMALFLGGMETVINNVFIKEVLN